MNLPGPPPNQAAMIDIKLRNGSTRRGEVAKNWRFGLWGGKNKYLGETPHDIVQWQYSGTGK